LKGFVKFGFVTKSECGQADLRTDEDLPIYRYARPRRCRDITPAKEKTYDSSREARKFYRGQVQSAGETASSSFRSAVSLIMIIFDGVDGSPGRGSPVFSAKKHGCPGSRINVDAFDLGRVLGFG
jgi:hypothetical protein